MNYSSKAEYLSSEEKQAVNEVIDLAVTEMGDSLDKVILFGSGLKGEHKDIDLAFMVDKVKDLIGESSLFDISSASGYVGILEKISITRAPNRMISNGLLNDNTNLKDLYEGKVNLENNVTIHYLVMHTDWFKEFESHKDLMDEPTYKFLKSLKKDGLELYQRDS